MTATTHRPLPNTRQSQPMPVAAGLRVLTRIEGRRLLTRPTVLVGAALSLLAMARLTWTTAPVLNRDDTAATGSLLVLSAATLLATNAAALRSRRYATDELLASMPTPPRTRTLGALLAVVGVVVVAGILVGAFLLWRLAADPVTSPDPFELLTGPALVALGGCLGVALARWAPSATVAPVVVVGLAALEFTVNLLTGGIEYGGRVKWLAPFVGQQGVAEELLVRPTGWHLAYLVALVVVLSCIAVLRHPVPRGTVAAAGIGTLVLVVAGAAQLRPLHPEQQAEALAAQLTRAGMQDCEQRNTVAYCALPGYEPWIDRWAEAVEPVMARLPEGARRRPLTVRQDFFGSSLEFFGDDDAGASSAEPTESEVRPSLWWGRGAATGSYEFALALGIASLAVGLSPDGAMLPPGSQPGLVGEGQQTCTTAGQGRAVMALWLAAETSERSAQYLHDEVARHIGATPTATATGAPREIYFDDPAARAIGALVFGGREAEAAADLLRQPTGVVAGLIHQHWRVLTDPATTTEQARALLARDDSARSKPPAGARVARPGSGAAGGYDGRVVACP